jgi:signal transduction histidine kinase
MDLSLLFHNIGFASGTIIALVMALFVYFKDPKSRSNQLFCLSFISTAIFCGSHVIGVNISNPYISRDVLMGNLSVIFIACFLTHCSFSMIGAAKKQRIFLIGMYTAAIFLTLIYIAFPNTFLLPSVPKLYFPNYYVAGNLQWIMRILFSLFLPSYFLIYLIYAYQKADAIMKNRLKYFFFALLFGYSTGSLAIPLVYNIPINPLWASFCVPLLAIPMAYALVKYNLMDIRVVTKRALLFGIIIALSSFAIFIVGYGNEVIVASVPNFPAWILPIIAGCIATIIGVVVWNKFREADLLKYEFVTVMTHKLRTPLTSIKWSAENLKGTVTAEGSTDLQNIQSGIERLVEVTDVLGGVSTESQEKYLYHIERADLGKLCVSAYQDSLEQAKIKNISFIFEGVDSLSAFFINADVDKIRSVLQIFVENALSYTPKDGLVSISLKQEKSSAVFSIHDSGIGMDKTELNHLFNQFYRGDAARSADTEGMGIGLFMAHKIIVRHDGKIWAESEGHGKGSTFFFSLPLQKTE